MIRSYNRSYLPDGKEAVSPITNLSKCPAVGKIYQLDILWKRHSNFRYLVPARYIGSCTKCGAKIP